MAEKQDSTGVVASDRAVYAACWTATVLALGLSYTNLLDFASQGLPLWRAVIWPLLIDVFVVVGELRLFSAVARREAVYVKMWATALTAVGLAASLAGNIAHAGWGTATWQEKLIAAAPPLAAAVSLGTGLGLVKLKARGTTRTTGQQVRETAAATVPPRDAPAARPARARGPGRPDGPSPGRLASWVADDQLAGLDMSRRQFAARHDITEHHARRALAGARNGN